VRAEAEEALAGYNVLWRPYAGMQARAIAAREFEVLVGGAKGPGKSDVLLFGATAQVTKPRYKALITRETGPQLLEIIDRSHRVFPRMASKPAWNGQDRRWTWPSGATLKFEAISRVEDVERIMGQEWGYVGQDEVGNIPDERVVDLVQAEIRCPDPSVIRMWRGSANPGKPGHHWIVRRFINKCGADGRRVIVRRLKLPNGLVAQLTRRFIPGTVLDNPIYANDPLYLAQLYTLPEVLRRQLLYGDWNAGVGQALDELEERVHIVRPFHVPEHWIRLGGFDWGYAHNWVFVIIAVTEDGFCFVLDTVRGRRHKTHEIADRIKSRVDLLHPSYTLAYTDSWSFQERGKDRDDSAETEAERLQQLGVTVTRGNTDRKKGLLNLRHYLAWKGISVMAGRADGEPALRFFDTPGNRWLFEQLQAMVTDEDDMEDVRKVNADPETGAGGDDGYDALRVAMASRPPRPIGLFYRQPVHAFAPETLAAMRENLYRDRDAELFTSTSGLDLYTSIAGTG
jgi:hypothetical protein